MAFLLYFKSSHALFSPDFSICNFFATLIPYQFEISKIHLSYFNRKIDPNAIEHSLRLNIVGLLYDPELEKLDSLQKISFNEHFDFNIVSHSDQSICLGLGLIRNVDTEFGILYIVTPVSELDLQNTNVIAIGNICLPDDLLTQKNDFQISNTVYFT
uniref:Polynucleotide 5'-hydroxyl-kinase NOL9 (Trinotate prediction) n=1 Tax=Myxobolus squamalis TaxID=59785 RepID=A0A6B2G5M2_MYXSQ